MEIRKPVNNEDQMIMNSILDLLNVEKTELMFNFKKANQWKVNQGASEINDVLKHIETKNISQTNRLNKAASKSVAKRMQLKINEKKTLMERK